MRAAQETIAVVDGYGIRLSVERGHLTIHDGIGRQRRTRTYSRIDRTLRRILILGHTGTISFEATRWCSEHNVAIVQIDADNKIISLITQAGLDDARLRRAQAIAPGCGTGLRIAQHLLEAKISAQASVVDHLLSRPILSESIRSQARRVEASTTIADCLDAESHAANAYFGAWAATVGITFTETDSDRVPSHWHTFSSRRSPLVRGRSPRTAATPINALLNYLYALAEIECRIALVTLGLDPGLGVVHVDAKARDSLALDLLEVVRPEVDQYLLRLISRRHFRAADFHETRDGQCRLMPDLAHDLASTSSEWARHVAPYAEQIAHILAASTSRTSVSTPLTRTNSRGEGRKAMTGRRSRASVPVATPLASTCRSCGVELRERRRKLCPTCWPRTRAALASERALRGKQAQADRRAEGALITSSETRAARAASLSARKQEQLVWELTGQATTVTNIDEIVTRLAAVPLSRIQQATGLTVSSCSRIRSGQLRPHQRHWAPLAALVPT